MGISVSESPCAGAAGGNNLFDKGGKALVCSDTHPNSIPQNVFMAAIQAEGTAVSFKQVLKQN